MEFSFTADKNLEISNSKLSKLDFSNTIVLSCFDFDIYALEHLAKCYNKHITVLTYDSQFRVCFEISRSDLTANELNRITFVSNRTRKFEFNKSRYTCYVGSKITFETENPDYLPFRMKENDSPKRKQAEKILSPPMKRINLA